MTPAKSRAETRATRATTVTSYLDSLAPEKRAVIEEARAFDDLELTSVAQVIASRLSYN